MNKKKTPLFVIHFLLIQLWGTVCVHGQIEGRVIDGEGTAIPYVNVILYQATDTTIIKGATTNEQGEFGLLHETQGEYMLGLSSLGYVTYYSNVFAMSNDPKIDLGTMTLLENRNELDEVVLSAKKNVIQNTSFGKVINVQSSLMTKGSNALQILERLPGVLLDKQNSQFSLNGQSGVVVMFNGRRMPLSMEEVMSLLESTLADTVEKVELITSPTAKYDADGGAGIINIIFKKNEYEGNQFNLNTALGYGVGEKASTSLQYAHGHNKVSLTGSYAFSHDRSKNGFEGSGTSNMPVLGAPSRADFSTYFNNNSNSHNFNMALGYQIRPKMEVGGELTYSFSKNHSISNVNNGRKLEGQDFFASRLVTDRQTTKKNLISSVYLGSELSKNLYANIDFNYLTYSNDSPALTTSEYFDGEGEVIVPENDIFTDGNRGQSKSNIQFGVFKVDFSLNLNEKLESEFGFKGSIAKNENDSRIETNNNGVWEVDPRSQSEISSDEKLWAAYTQFKFLINEKSTLQAGVRYEDWNRTLSNNEDPFAVRQFFPSFSYQYTLSENENLNFNYHRRISRPSYTDLITSLYYNDPIAIFTGNPVLKPAITNTVQLDYNIKGFNVGLSYQKELNPILRYQFTTTPQNDILIVSPQNGEYQKSLNVFLNVPVQWSNWAKLNVSGTSSYRKYSISYIPNPAEKLYFFQNLNFNQGFKLPWQMDMELSGWYNFPSYNGSHITEGFGIVNFGLAKKFKKEWGTLQFTVTDIFRSFNIYNHNGGMAPVVFDIDTKSRYRDESAFSRIFRLSYSRSFGHMTSKKIRSSGTVEELKRVD
ncbi:hypothetical protein GGR42_001357 [Saonia flava]|uniref:Outer membrane protein beta-barrel domain-containing protein n=1 Tax=Saonia flava TaxID=523696 RepID=A0A846QZ19_9FLAO|nr:TonB-dependent receptor [Saonia flava]NJB70895.1 hypothetical protein [Saonia flava]